MAPDEATTSFPADSSDRAAGPSSRPAPPPGEATAPGPTPPPGSVAAAPPSGSVEGGDGRPADAAREALRAARRQARADTAAKGAATPRRLSGPARRPHAAGRSRTADARALAVREFIAGAFRLPPEAETDPAGELPTSGKSAGAGRETAGATGESVTSAGGSARSAGGSAGSSGGSPGSFGESLASSGDSPTGNPVVTSHVEPGPGPTPAPAPASAPASSRAAHAVGPARGPAPADASWLPAVSSHEPPTPRQRADAHPERGPAAPGPAPRSAAPGRPGPVPPGRPRASRSMAAPDRDGELRRTFPALPPRAAAGGDFAGTWWGNAWVTALEDGALDAARLARGRVYAERGHVDAITVTPGLVLAYVQGSRPRPYRVQVRLRTLGDDDWQRFLDAAVERPGHIAALLDKELPPSLADCGVPLLPGPGDLAPQCSCPDSGHPCKHAAALCYQTARLLDADPFVLLLLRGRGERDLLDALSRLNAARAARAAQDRGPAPLPGVRASEALAARSRPPLPAPLPTPAHPEQPPAYPAAPGGPDPFALDQLATDAAARAYALLTTGRDPVGGLSLWQDAVRLAAARPGSGLTAGSRAFYAALASAAGRGPAELARAVAAWRQGGPDGLDVLEEPWDPPAGRFDRARPLLLAADLPAFRPWRNRLTHPRGHVQLRLGRAGLWYAYESEPGHDDWWPRGTPDLDPVGALTGLGGPGDL
ncbi:SWIM zinc finger family protein [Streptomyces sp. AC627_RSS907]|uniref:SWIM zinc finger family protein n=1 Tax=Streptomyces sp. AC627_RSS907 TaxID=2823684 RepID=UPI0020B896D5|nr:SWIM zinc finger family protein [Streptomyces sp. AC627_RSS907]